MNVLDTTATSLRDAIASGQVSAKEATRAVLDRISSVNGALNAFNLVDADRALDRATQIVRRRSARWRACRSR